MTHANVARLPKVEAEHATGPRDPLIGIAAELRRLELRSRQLQRTPKGEDVVAKSYREREEEEILDRIDHFRNYASSIRATSLEGALFQLSLMQAVVCEFADFDLTERESDARKETCLRLLHSAIPCLSEYVPEARELGLLAPLSENLDPWRPYEEIVEEILTPRSFQREVPATAESQH